MKIVVVDDERLALVNFLKLLQQAEPNAEVFSFSNSAAALEFLPGNKIDIAFLDVETGDMNGIALAKKFKDACPSINIIFVTSYSQYMLEAFKLHASGYLLKPVRLNDLEAELKNLRYPLQKVRVQTFGNFEVFVDGKLLDFPRAKSKECLAYLIDRKGARVSVSELATILWEDKLNDNTTRNNTYQVVFTLMRTLKDAGIADIVIKQRRELAADPAKIDCDYYGFLRGEAKQIEAFSEEYMTNYSWAEFTLSELTRKKNHGLKQT